MIAALTPKIRGPRRVAVYFYPAARRRGLSERSQWFACWASKGVRGQIECVAIYDIHATTDEEAAAAAIARAPTGTAALRGLVVGLRDQLERRVRDNTALIARANAWLEANHG